MSGKRTVVTTSFGFDIYAADCKGGPPSKLMSVTRIAGSDEKDRRPYCIVSVVGKDGTRVEIYTSLRRTHVNTIKSGATHVH